MITTRRVVWISLLLAIVSGCSKPEQITRYQVPKEQRVARRMQRPAPAPTGPKRRILGAIVLSPPKAWFFKITGPDEVVGQEQRITSFLGFLDTVKFVGKGEKAVPEWTLYKGWRREPGSQFRYATIQIGDENQPLEMSVSNLALPKGDPDPFVLLNINRWRRQLVLEPFAQIEPNDGVLQRKLPSGVPMTVVHFSSGSGSLPAGHPPLEKEPAPGDAGKAVPTTSLLTYDTPEGWKPGRVDGIRRAAFKIAADGQNAEMTVIDLAAGAGVLLPNINRWRGQLQLGKMTQKQLDAQLQKIEVDGHPGHYIHLVGPEKAKPQQATLGVIVLAQGKAWFLKLKGDAKLVGREKKRFEDFTRSLRFARR